MTVRTDPAAGFQAAATEGVLRLVTFFHAAIRIARQILAAGPDEWYAESLLRSVSLALNSLAVEDAALPDHLVGWVMSEPLKGSGFGTPYIGDLHPEWSSRYNWKVEAPDGTWQVVNVDGGGAHGDEDLYWGGEEGQGALATAVVEALHYQGRWPEAVVRIGLGDEQVMLIPPIDGEPCPLCGGPLRINGQCLNDECAGSSRPDRSIMEALGLPEGTRMVLLAHLPPPDPSTYHGLCHICNKAGTDDMGLCLDPACPGSTRWAVDGEIAQLALRSGGKLVRVGDDGGEKWLLRGTRSPLSTDHITEDEAAAIVRREEVIR